MTASWDTAPCSLVEVDRRLRGAYYLHHQGDDTDVIIPFSIIRLIHLGLPRSGFPTDCVSIPPPPSSSLTWSLLLRPFADSSDEYSMSILGLREAVASAFGARSKLADHGYTSSLIQDVC
jgi:hypothetical protein